MADTPTTHDIVLEVVAGKPQTGGWCDTCLLPSLVTVPIYAHNPRTGNLIPLGSYTYCDDCLEREGASDG